MLSLYVIQNRLKDKVYVGQSKNPKVRLRAHKCSLSRGTHSNPHLQSAWNEYGEAAFEFYLLCEVETVEEADEAECFYIEWFRVLGLAYNHTGGGKGYYNPTPEIRARMREAKVGRKLSEEHKAKLSKAFKNRKFSEEHRQKLSASQKGNQHWLGKSHTEETKELLRQKNKGQVFPPISEETRQKLREAQAKPGVRERKIATATGNKHSLGVHPSEETKQKLREVRKLQVMKPVTEETKQKMREAWVERKKRNALAMKLRGRGAGT